MRRAAGVAARRQDQNRVAAALQRLQQMKVEDLGPAGRRGETVLALKSQTQPIVP